MNRDQNVRLDDGILSPISETTLGGVQKMLSRIAPQEARYLVTPTTDSLYSPFHQVMCNFKTTP